jgi:transcriptional regulator with XRE-family HTH domain
MMKINFKKGVHRAVEVTGISIEEAAIKNGLSRTWLSSMVCRNNPTAGNIENAAKAFDIPLDKFLQFCLDS